ncbi:MAG TPA: hypothetical protein VKT82_28670 [Ktedonobacterales bacterium]|nr:hypothetical protein [Ktedonobacterales bacterium]
MFDISALVMLTIFNLIALVQIAANILAPARLQRGPVLGAAVICLATSLTGLAMALLVPSPVVGVASITIAALVNLFAVLGTGLDHISDPGSTEAIHYLRGLARLAIVGEPHEPAKPRRRASWQSSAAPAETAAFRSASAKRQSLPTYITSDVLPRLLAAASGSAQRAPKTKQPTTSLPRIPASAQPLKPRQNFIVPHRPNRLPTSSLAFLLSVDPQNAPDIFADARASSELSTLAHRVNLVVTNRPRPSIAPQSMNIWPTTFSEPDPAWQTSYGRLPAIAFGV